MITELALNRARDLADCIPETPENYPILRSLRRVLTGQENDLSALAITPPE